MELSTPITVFWDLPHTLSDVGYLKRICSDIINIRPLMLQLNSAEFPSDDASFSFLETFNESQTALSLTVPIAALSRSNWNVLANVKLKELLFGSENTSDLDCIAKTFGEQSWLFATGVSPGISITATLNNWRDLPFVVEFCRAQGIKRLVLPMQRLYSKEVPFLLSGEGQQELQNALAAVGGTAGIELTIHDPFLWRAFNPRVPFPQGGCQAANTMIAISRDGDVYPCPCLPVKLGTIGEATLKEIVASSVKKDFRRKLLAVPADCSECSKIGECRGGCRGRAYVQHGNLDGIDSACR